MFGFIYKNSYNVLFRVDAAHAKEMLRSLYLKILCPPHFYFSWLPHIDITTMFLGDNNEGLYQGAGAGARTIHSEHKINSTKNGNSI